jgi:ABC-type transporter MlaC component
MGVRSKSILALSLMVIAALSATSAVAEDVPNVIALRKVSETRYNLSINLLDQYASQEIGIRIRRITGPVSSIITLPSKVLGAEGRAAVAINQKLLPDDVFLFLQGKTVIYKVAVRDSTVIDMTNPDGPVQVIFESATAVAAESATAVIDHPNDAAVRALSGKRYLLTINLLDRYAGQEIEIERIRKVGGKEVRTVIAKKVLGAFGKASVVVAGEFKSGDLFLMNRAGIELFRYRAR